MQSATCDVRVCTLGKKSNKEGPPPMIIFAPTTTLALSANQIVRCAPVVVCHAIVIHRMFPKLCFSRNPTDLTCDCSSPCLLGQQFCPRKVDKAIMMTILGYQQDNQNLKPFF